jgi:hypothetical protein
MLLDTSGLVCCFDADDARHLAAVAGNPSRSPLPARRGGANLRSSPSSWPLEEQRDEGGRKFKVLLSLTLVPSG